ncbi:MAG TPA: metallophosphoesterase [Abditibacteriaceae bacterium]|jgi:hypothetical protein
MSNIIRWLHLSDFHVGKETKGGHIQWDMFKRVIEHVKEKKETENWTPHFLLLTGDLANSGHVSEYEDFYYQLLFPLHEILGFEIESRTFSVPGNHDVDRGRFPEFNRSDFTASASRHFEIGDGKSNPRASLLPRFEAYDQIDFCAPCTKNWVSSPHGAYHAVNTVEGLKVGIVGINTAWLCKGSDDEHQLTPGKPLLEHALSSLTDCQLRIVLGHHSLDWFIPTEKRKIASILGQNSAIYLYGDQHEIWVAPSWGSGHDFLTVQGGSVFQEQEGEQWRNSLLWSEADIEKGVLRLQPRVWNADHQRFELGVGAFPTDPHNNWWEYPLPGTPQAQHEKSIARLKNKPPRGWSVVTHDELNKLSAPLSLDQAVSFFNGAVPDWQEALSSSTPRRKVVTRLVTHFSGLLEDEQPRLVLLLGAGCEGKTTALLQAAHDVVQKHRDWQILVRKDETQPIEPEKLLPLLSCGQQWLVVIDEADSAALSLFSLLDQSSDELRGKVHFLLSCRDSDWRSSKDINVPAADQLSWSSVGTLRSERQPPLDLDEAQDIVRAWSQFDDDGLGKLKNTSEAERSSELLSAAQKEASGGESAFFGALLTVRFDDHQLKKHARTMLERLKSRPIASDKTLFDALVLIAAMHSEGLLFLERPVLSAALQCPMAQLRKNVLQPLGKEAVTTTSDFILTRHRKIAQAIMAVAHEEFGEEIDECFVNLAKAAIDVANQPALRTRENPARWRYELPEHFFNSDRKLIGIAICEAVLSRESRNYKTLLKMAQLYRESNEAEEAARLFREFPVEAPKDRAFYSEWGTTEGNCGNYYADYLLNVYSLSDQYGEEPINRLRAELSLVGCCIALNELYKDTLNTAFLRGCITSVTLGKALSSNPRTIENFNRCYADCVKFGANVPNIEEAVNQIKDHLECSTVAASYNISDIIREHIGDISSLTYDNFGHFVRVATSQREY